MLRFPPPCIATTSARASVLTQQKCRSQAWKQRQNGSGADEKRRRSLSTTTAMSTRSRTFGHAGSAQHRHNCARIAQSWGTESVPRCPEHGAGGQLVCGYEGVY
eukprot:2122653-Rhodomonas_salina.2